MAFRKHSAVCPFLKDTKRDLSSYHVYVISAHSVRSTMYLSSDVSP